jgi:hypothetical protein
VASKEKDPDKWYGLEEAGAREGREKKSLVTLGGDAITVGGKLTKSGYFEFLANDLDDYSDIEFTPEQARKISSHLRTLSTGSTAMAPMYCAGSGCPFADRCPLHEMGKAPIGKQCLIEVQLMKQWIMNFFEEYDIDPQNFTEVAYANELAELMIYEMRLNMNLAKAENASLVHDQSVGVDRYGEPIIQKQISPFMEQKERIANRKSKIIKLMVGDRQEKYKKEAALKVKLDDDPSTSMADMRARLENLKREMTKIEAQATQQLEAGETSTPKDAGILTPEDLIGTPDK